MRFRAWQATGNPFVEDYRSGPRGSATLVGEIDISPFGASPVLDSIQAASHNGVLYAVGRLGRERLALRTGRFGVIDPTLPLFMPRGTSSNFGVDVNAPQAFISHEGLLYMAGGRSSTSISSLRSVGLYTVNEVTGVATRLGSAFGFGVGEIFPVGFASIDGVLYMAGRNTRRLYIVDTSTSLATRVGSADDFGLGPSDPVGFGSHNGELYMTDSTHDALFTVDRLTGIAQQAGDSSSFGLSLGTPGPIFSHDGNLYMVRLSTVGAEILYILGT